MKNLSYVDKLKDPRWIEVAARIRQRDNCTCRHCGTKDRILDVHHIYYERGLEPWEYPDDALLTLCRLCHGSLEDLKKAVGILATNKSIKDRFWEVVHAHEASICQNAHAKPLCPTPESAEAVFKAMREEVERAAA